MTTRASAKQKWAFVKASSFAARAARARWLPALYWLAPAFLFAVQLRVSMAAMTQLRFEEARESIRNVYWLDLHKIYDGTSSNVGYYGLLLVAYKCFGFSVFAAKYVRAALALVSLFCLAEVLRRVMGRARAVVPLVAIGLSPTLLYFNAIQTSYGIDLQYCPICLLLLMAIRFKADFINCALSVLLGMTSMIACMSFPTFVFCLPALAAGVLIKLHRRRAGDSIRAGTVAVHAACLFFGLAAPLAFALLWVDRPGILLNDPLTHTGVFRGDGTLTWNAAASRESMKIALRDLLASGQSYHFVVARAEFAGVTGRAALYFVLGASIFAFIQIRELRLVVALAWGTIAISLFLPSLGAGYPGVRRCTGMLAGFYALYAVTWQRLAMTRRRRPWPAWTGIVFCLLLPLHGLLAMPANRAVMATPTPLNAGEWFSVKGGPERSVDYWLKTTEENRPLLMLDEKNEKIFRPYAEIYATLAGWRRWNKKPEIPIYGFDPKTNALIRLQPRLWETYYWPH